MRGTDDGVLLPPGTGVLDAEVGVAAFASRKGEVVGYTIACLWSTQQRKTVAGWTKSVAQMKAWGTPLGADEEATILGYLEARFGVPEPAPADAPR